MLMSLAMLPTEKQHFRAKYKILNKIYLHIHLMQINCDTYANELGNVANRKAAF